MTKYGIGVWFWGVVGSFIGVLALIFVLENFTKSDVIAPVLATLVATVGVVWSWFFQLAQKDSHHKEVMALEREKLTKMHGNG